MGAIGAVLSYRDLYVFTPFGLAILLLTVLIARRLPSVGVSRLPEALGLLAGPGVFSILLGSGGAGGPGVTIAGALLVGAAVVAYCLVAALRHQSNPLSTI